MTDTEVTVECSRLRALVLLYVGVPLCIVLALIFVWLMISAMSLPMKKLGLQMLVSAYIFCPVMIALFVWVGWTMLRYRESLFTKIRVSDCGILVRNARYGELALSWADVRTTHSSFGKMVVLESAKLIRPLAIMSFGKGDSGLSPQFLRAKAIVKRNVGERWREQWLLR